MSKVDVTEEFNDAALLSDAGKALFRLGRVFHRHPLPEALKSRTEGGVELSKILAVQAVEAVFEADEEVTVGAVAQRLGLDPSTASRVVAEAVRDGLLARAASQADGRRSLLELTPSGHALAEDAARYQRSVFESVTDTWTDKERREFARLFVKLVEKVDAAHERLGRTEAPVGK